jgi:hypothetical protein
LLIKQTDYYTGFDRPIPIIDTNLAQTISDVFSNAFIASDEYYSHAR